MNNYYINVNINIDAEVIKEELKKFGILSNFSIYQSCHLIEVREKYYLCHFKEMFSLYDFINNSVIDENKIYMSNDDFLRRNYIIHRLMEKGMIQIENQEILDYIMNNKNKVNIYENIMNKKLKIIQKFVY